MVITLFFLQGDHCGLGGPWRAYQRARHNLPKVFYGMMFYVMPCDNGNTQQPGDTKQPTLTAAAADTIGKQVDEQQRNMQAQHELIGFLIMEGGGRILPRLPDKRRASSLKDVYVIASRVHVLQEEVQAVQEHWGRPLLTQNYILDCASAYQVLDITQYQLLGSAGQ